MMGLKGISHTLGCKFLNVPVLPSRASTSLNRAESMGDPDTSLLKAPFLLDFDFFPSDTSLTNSALLQSTAILAMFFHEGVLKSNETAGVLSAPNNKDYLK